ncbi:MAG: FAD:protein FMN transferase [Deltaproteobacteria bacterium]|nr:FAD:protein FMN transferase [Deltaproteobacteria bacterium]
MIGDPRGKWTALPLLLILLGDSVRCSAAWATPAPRAGGTGERFVTRTRSSMGTLVTLTAWTADDQATLQAFDEAFAEFERIDHLMTTWTRESDTSRINAAAGRPDGVQVSPEIIKVVEKATWTSRLTEGAFDITVGVFSGAWKFDEDKDGSIPAAEVVEERRRLVGWQDVLLDARKGTVRLRRHGQRISLGGIAKGHAVDRAAAVLCKRGVRNFIVQAGGDMFVAGRRGDRPWRVGIRDPRGKSMDSFFAFADIEDRTFSTSGDYERSIVIQGKRYHHILDPRTGYPATECRSVTVLAKDALTADALSTALFVLGPKKGLALVENLPDVEAVFVGSDNQVTVSKGLREKLTIVNPPRDGI